VPRLKELRAIGLSRFSAHTEEKSANSLPEKKKTLVSLQWVLVIVTSYFVLFSKGEVIKDPRAFALIVLCLAFMLVLNRLPLSAFDHKLFAPTLVIANTIFISVAIGLNRENPWDFFIVFYFGLFIAAIGESLLQIVVGCLIITVVSVILSSSSSSGISAIDSDLLLRVPFIFGVSLLYGYLGEQVKREKKRAETAEETQRVKRQLVAALAHDIKNPLSIIMCYAETGAARPVGRHEGSENIEAFQTILDSVQQIVKLVTGFLHASRAESGKFELVQQPVQLNLLVRDVGQQQMGNLRKKNISLNMDLDEDLPEIMGDDSQLDRVLWNLVGNAIKFTPMGGTITLSSRAANGQACISVKDNGMGMPEDELPHLFTEFRRLKGTAKIEGTGLGLFIVKTIVEAHGGTVEVESKDGQGSTFTIGFPACGINP